MFRELFVAVLTWIISSFNVLKSFVLDETLHINYFHFLLFTVFISIVLRVVNFIKQVQEVEEEKQKAFARSEKERYNNWLRSNAVRRHR